jgi:Mn2+/Fe2+ NRAMP family transporter
MKNIENILLWFVVILTVIITYLVHITGGDTSLMILIGFPIIALRTYRSYLLIKLNKTK